MKNVLLGCLVFIVVVLIGFGTWKLKRYVNWKFSYGGKVSAKIEQLEKRVEALEKK